jgi:hypothetical protein
MPASPVVRIVRPGNTTKPNPFTIFVIANPSLEAPWKSGTFIADPIMADQRAFDTCVQYVEDVLFGRLPHQGERSLADPTIGPYIRLVSLFLPGLPAEDANALVGQDSVSNLLISRRPAFNPFLARYAHLVAPFTHQADIAYAVSKSESHTRASAWFTSDDDGQPGVNFTLDGTTLVHRYFHHVPGMVALHATSHSLTALHEFSHALSSYSNGSVIDLYIDNVSGVNNKRGRPIPAIFAAYNSTTLATDPGRGSLGYPSGWQSYHCELHVPTFPAVMDNYWLAPGGVPERCEHDKITRQFLIDRVQAKMAR